MTVEKVNFPQINIECKDHALSQSEQYENGIIKLLQKTLTQECFSPEKNKEEKIKSIKFFFNDTLPIIKWFGLETFPSDISITLLCRHRVHVKNYFYDMISRWLIPRSRLNIDLFFVADFKLPEVNGEDTYSIAEAVLHIKNEDDLKEIKKNIRSIETEIRLGVLSDYHANKILEFKGLSSDKKTAMIQEKIGALIRTRSKDFGQGIFSDMQYFLVTCKEEFKTSRDYHHISRIISVLYFIRKLLKQKITAQPHQRHLLVKFLKTRIDVEEQKKSVMGIIVGVNFLKENEVCGKNHLIKAVRHFIPHVRAIDDSFFLDRKVKDAMQLLYLEVEKEDGKDFSLEEIQMLRDSLPEYLKNHIEQLIHPIFMPRNEEEVVRNIMTLSHQLKYVHDIPQVIISFDKQTASEISFTVILLRVLKTTDFSLKEIFLRFPTKFKMMVERVKRAGILRRKHIKEANVFRIFAPTADYIRPDHSVDLNKARQDILHEIQRLFGEVRDYNGGMIYKQNQVYHSLKKELGSFGMKNELLLEKFFYSITPVEMTVVRKQEPLKNLFLLLLQMMTRLAHRSKKKDILIKQERDKIYAIISLDEIAKKKKISDRIEKLSIETTNLLTFHHHTLDTSYLGYIYFSEDKHQQKMFVETVQKSV